VNSSLVYTLFVSLGSLSDVLAIGMINVSFAIYDKIGRVFLASSRIQADRRSFEIYV